jgi:membrane-associated phospholipid phosphatase
MFFKIKVSLHTLALSLFTTFMGVISYHYKIRLIVLISFLLLLTGYIAMARLKLKAHTLYEVYLGYFIGILVLIFSYLLYYKI